MLFEILISLTIGFSASAQELNATLAKKISERAFDYAAKKKWNITVAIVNSEGNLLYFERGDDAHLGSVLSSQEKAFSSNAFRRPTSAFMDAVASGRTGLLSGSNIVAIEGGVPIIIKGKHSGAIGISGARAPEDEEVANEALKFLQK